MKHFPLKQMILAAIFAALTAVGAFLKIPGVGDVSFTLQVLFCFLSGLLLGPWWGAASQIVYVLLGLFGLPVFTSGGGFGSFTFPTFGFVLGLIPAAVTVGLLVPKKPEKRNFWRLLAAQAVALAVLYLCGLPYLYIIMNGKLSVWKTIWTGCLIFLPYDALKMVCASALSVRLHKTGLVD